MSSLCIPGTVVFVAVLIASLAAAPAYAVDKHWNVGTGMWGISTNWSPNGLPGVNNIMYVDYFANGSPGMAVVATAVGSPISVSVVNGDTVRINSMGSLGVQGDFIVGVSNTHGTLNVLNPNRSSPTSGASRSATQCASEC